MGDRIKKKRCDGKKSETSEKARVLTLILEFGLSSASPRFNFRCVNALTSPAKRYPSNRTNKTGSGKVRPHVANPLCTTPHLGNLSSRYDCFFLKTAKYYESKDELFSVSVKKESKQLEGNPEEANFIDKACTFQGKEMMVSPKIMRTKMRTRFFFLREHREEAAEQLQFTS